MRDFSSFKRVVVKVGTNLLSSADGIDESRINKLCAQIAKLREMGFQVLLVTSGAIGLGAKEIKHKNRVVHIPMRQACAAIGQPILMDHYRRAFSEHQIVCSQVLLTRNDLNNRKTYNNLRSSVSTLLALGIVPIFNENDVISTAEIGSAFGDNDRMSAMVASKIDADLLILLTDIDGLYTGNPKTDKKAVLIKDINKIDQTIMAYAKGAGSTFSTGGMKTKLLAASIASMAYCGTIIASGYVENVLIKIMNGEEIGSYIHPGRRLNQRERWIINNSHVGTIVVDEGARQALFGHRSLLPSGIIKVEGIWEEGDVVAIAGPDGRLFAKAVPYFNSTEVALMMGHKTHEIEAILGEGKKDCIFRPEDVVFLNDAESL